jgi:carbonic anhydrase
MAKRRSSKPQQPNVLGNGYVELVRRYDLDDPEPKTAETPSGANVAIERLREGNARFATFMNNCRESIAGHPVVVPCDKSEVGLGEHDSFGRPKQSPLAVVVGCSDAREPTEILFGQGFDDLFTIRVAGNVLGDECVGSVIYALDKFAPGASSTSTGSLKLIVIVGHRSCGGVHAAIEAHEADPSSLLERADSIPHPVAAIIARIAPVVAVSAWAVDNSYGAGASRDKKHTEVLCEIAVYLNAALAAYELVRVMKARRRDDDPGPVAVRFGVFDLSNDFVQGVPPPYESTSTQPKQSFAEPPVSLDWFPRTAQKCADLFAKKFPRGDDDMKRRGYTSSASHRMKTGLK